MNVGKLISVVKDSEVHGIIHGLEDKFGLCVIVWSPEDAIERAKENNITLSQEDAVSIMEQIRHHHDCNYGISWETLDYWIDQP